MRIFFFRQGVVQRRSTTLLEYLGLPLSISIEIFGYIVLFPLGYTVGVLVNNPKFGKQCTSPSVEPSAGSFPDFSGISTSAITAGFSTDFNIKEPHSFSLG